MDDVMAIGDNLNDKNMLEVVGHSVAMENGSEEIKRICKVTTLTNAEHGVAHAIEEILV